MLTDAAVAQQLKQLHNDGVDVLIIGAGATGCGCALEAAASGLSVAMVDHGDIAGGTSSRSTKLVHGGVRYLEQAVLGCDRGQYRLVKEALRERAVILRNAPHLARPLELITPCTSRLQTAYMWAGLKMYDWLAGHQGLGTSCWVPGKQLRDRFPQLTAHAAGVSYFDGQFDDARLALAIATAASERGATVLPYCPVTAMKQSDVGYAVTITDRLSNTETSISAKSIINAAGIFVDDIRCMLEPNAAPLLKPSSGIHLVFDRQWWPHEHGLLIPKTPDGRVVFALPWQGRLLVGTTDQSAVAEHNPQATEADIDYLLGVLKNYFDPCPTRADVRSAWSGLRPLVAPRSDTGATKTISRDHVLEVSPHGLVTITGGKWTTYRLMARDAVAAACKQAALPADLIDTAHLTLPGGATEPHIISGFSESLSQALGSRYGDRAEHVAALTEVGDNPEWLGGEAALLAEVRWAARHEWARRIDDVLLRRLRIAMLNKDLALQAIDQVGTLLGHELGWSDEQLDRERQHAEKIVQSM